MLCPKPFWTAPVTPASFVRAGNQSDSVGSNISGSRVNPLAFLSFPRFFIYSSGGNPVWQDKVVVGDEWYKSEVVRYEVVKLWL